MSAIKLITFDVSGTIMRVAGSIGQQTASVARMYGMEIDPVYLEEAYKHNFLVQVAKHPNYGANEDMNSKQWWTEVIKPTLPKRELSDRVLSALTDDLYKHFLSRKSWKIQPETEKVLSKLRHKKFRLGVISNFDDRLDQILKNLALRHHFSFVLTSMKLKSHKPDPVMFEKALEIAQVKSSQALHIGSHPKNDYNGAIEAGLNALLFWDSDDQIPDGIDESHVVRDMASIERYLKTF